TNGSNTDITVNPTKQNTTATNESIPALGDTKSTIPVIVGMFLLATSLVLIRRK
ncbi:LPXTG cell wall anchor domain-containing protein, partial [Listeria monocytogenes]|nr:LPXTG cell wall anchor domain-containing protein [Listeria monocytogenes]